MFVRLSLIFLLSAAGPALAEDPVQAVPLEEVRLLPGPFKEMQELHRTGYVASLDPDRLLFEYRKTAGLDQSPGIMAGYGGWDGGFIRGHLAGHYLSAASRLYAATGDTAFRDKANRVVAGMAACQNAMKTGHLAAFPESVLDKLEKENKMSGGIAVPYYTIHKVMAGLIDAYRYLGNKEALDVAQKMSDRYAARMEALTPGQIEKLLRTDKSRNPNNEFGGMSDALTELAEASGEKRHLKFARVFIRDWFTKPLAAAEDKLAGLHANTHIAQAVGIARYANATGDPELARASENFWKIVTGTHSFVIGGNSFKEWFDKACVEVSPSVCDHKSLPYNTAESCNTHNMLKLTRQLFERSPDAAKARFFERALYNHILASIAPDTGRMTYFLPMHGDFRTYLSGTECCVGSGIENTGRYGEGIYFQRGPVLWINLYIPSQLNWMEQGIILRQEGNIPYTEKVTFSIMKASGRSVTLKFRIPDWLSAPAGLAINGISQSLPVTDSGYIDLTRTWAVGDTVTLSLPSSLRVVHARDAKEMSSLLYGPLVLAMRLGREQLPSDLGAKDQCKNIPSAEVPSVVGDPSRPDLWLRLVDPATLAFEAVGCGPATGRIFQPLNAVHHERYAVYFPILTAGEAAAPGNSLKPPAETSAAAKPPDPDLVDEVEPGLAASESAHDTGSEKSRTGKGQKATVWRDAAPDGWFSYTMALVPGQPLDLVCTYWGADRNRTFDVLANGQKLATQSLDGSRGENYFKVSYRIPESVLSGQQNINVRFQGLGIGRVGGLFGLRVVRRP